MEDLPVTRSPAVSRARTVRRVGSAPHAEGRATPPVSLDRTASGAAGADTEFGAGGAAPEVVVASGECYSGLLAFRGEVHIDGEVEGDVLGFGSLSIGESGRLEGRVEVDELRVAGTLVGEVEARRRIELLPTAHVEGTLRAPGVEIKEGSYLRGHCRSGAPPPAAKKTGDSTTFPA